MLNYTNFILGGIRNFPSNDNAVKKWGLSRAEQSKNTLKLKEKAETSKTREIIPVSVHQKPYSQVKLFVKLCLS